MSYMDGVVPESGVADIVARRLQWVVGRRLTAEDLEDIVLSEVLTMLADAEDEVGHLSPRTKDRRVRKVGLN